MAGIKRRNCADEAGCAKTCSNRAALRDTKDCGEASEWWESSLAGEGRAEHLQTGGRQ